MVLMQRITYYEREKIEWYLRRRFGIREISKKLNRDHSVVSREILRNSGQLNPYTASVAQAATERRKHEKHRRKLDEDRNFDLHFYVEQKLKQGWSPKVIAGNIQTHPDDPEVKYLRGISVSHEAIYQYIYEGEGRYQSFYHYLRRARPKRQRRYSRKHRENLSIPERISIHERPTTIDQRRDVGHWETDTMKFRKQVMGLSVQCERKLKFVLIHKVKDGSAEATKGAIEKGIQSLSPSIFQSLTWDNGKEGVCHRDLRDIYGIPSYFCDPYASWQKGGVENVNGMIRRYLPRQTDMSKVTEKEIERIQNKINRIPRASLNYRSPHEVLQEYLQGVVH